MMATSGIGRSAEILIGGQADRSRWHRRPGKEFGVGRPVIKFPLDRVWPPAAPDDLTAHTSPVGWEHIAFSGDFLWDRAAQAKARKSLILPRGTRAA